MNFSRIAVFIFIALLWGCQTSPQQQASGKTETVKKDSMASELAQQSYDSISRLHTSSGQTIYVPVYSHIYQLNQRKTFNLTATLSIRNADVTRSFTLTQVLYYDSQGKLVKNYLDEPVEINPLASTSFVVEENDLRGGVGANFIVTWKSEQSIYPPVVEAVMISTSQQQGISFVSVGRVLEDKGEQSSAASQ